MSLEVRRGRPCQEAPSTQFASLSLAEITDHLDDIETAEAYVVVGNTPYGNPRRRVYLSLHHATNALRRAQAKSQLARLMLCKLVPVAADLDGEWSA